MNSAAHAAVFWMAGALFGLLLGWTLFRKTPAADETTRPSRQGQSGAPARIS